MKKHIDADKLKVEIRKHLIPTVHDRSYDEWEDGKDSGLRTALDIIDSLQQEQPEVDLEEEIDRFLKSEESTTYENAGSYKVAVKDPKKIARHFYELGLNARKQ